MPRLLGKDFTKVDFPKLRADMNKWYETMPTSAVESWKQYLQTADQNESSHGNSPTCSIHLLKTAYRRPLISANSSTGYKDLNLRFREKEIAPLEEVICCFGNFVETEGACNQIASQI